MALSSTFNVPGDQPSIQAGTSPVVNVVVLLTKAGASPEKPNAEQLPGLPAEVNSTLSTGGGT